MLYHRMFINGSTMDATSGAYPSGAPDFTSVRLRRTCCSIFYLSVVFCGSLFVCMPVSVWPWHCLPFFASRLLIIPFGIFKPFFDMVQQSSQYYQCIILTCKLGLFKHNVVSSTPRLSGVQTHNVRGNRHCLHTRVC